MDSYTSMIETIELSRTGTFQFNRNHIIDQSENVDSTISKIEDANIAEVIMELNNLQNVYESSLAAGGRILQKGLINFI